jgi:hypothetical protein
VITVRLWVAHAYPLLVALELYLPWSVLNSRLPCLDTCVAHVTPRSPWRGHGALIAALRAHPGVLRRLDGLHLRVVDPDLPLELKGADNATILDYYRDLLSEPSVVSRRCRVMLLGNGGVGKTTLAQRLVTGTPIQPGSTDTTHGVLQRASKQPPLDHALCAFNRRSLRDRYSPCADYWTLSHEQAACIPSDGTLEVSITDFGGQVRTTRAMFFSHTLRNCTLIDSTTARC